MLSYLNTKTFMTKDYAKRRRNQHFSRRQESAAKQSVMPAWLWMSAGLLLGVGLSGMLYWKLHRTATPLPDAIVDIHEDPPKISDAKPSKKSKKIALAQTETPQHSSRFDFYTVLPSMNHKGKEADPTLATPTTTLDLALQSTTETASSLPSTALVDDEPTLSALPQEAIKAPKPAQYFIQVGSFRRMEQAEGVKAELALTGFEASIQTFKMGDRDNRYRVLIGPFSSKDQAQNRQLHLEQALQLHSVVLKITV